LAALLLFSFLGSPLAADTITGTVYRDLDANGVRSAEEQSVAEVRLLVYSEDGKVLAQGRSGSGGSFELTVEAAAGTPVRVTATGLQGRFLVRSTPLEAIELAGATRRHQIDLALVAPADVGRLEAARRSPPPLQKTADLLPDAAPAGALKMFFPNGLPYPNVGVWVTMRCAGGNNLFDIDVEMDDRLESVYAVTPLQNVFGVFGYPYTFVSVPGLGERCRVLSPTEHGAVEPTEPPPPPNPPGGVGSGG
jgi:hypothetical protein